MTKLLNTLGATAAIALLGLLGGCTLYFGGDDSSGSSTYCGADGQYECQGGDCYWQGPTCDEGSGASECATDADCASGCYCGDNQCVEAGYCSNDTECGFGYTCDEGRSSCVPADRCDGDAACPAGYTCDATGTCQPLACASDADCAAGRYCDVATGGCAESCTCATDAEASSQGFGYCDEGRTTCMPGTDPDHGSCAGEVTCNIVAPVCPPDAVPLIKDGCYTGLCEAIASCDVAPGCETLNTEGACLARGECFADYNGHGCTTADGSSCTAGASNCTCTTFTFDQCHADAP